MLKRFVMAFRLSVLAVAVLFSLPAHAELKATFYSHEFGKNFPHAFFVLKGELANGKTVDTSYGFTAMNVSPAILWGSVKGHVKAPSSKYIASSSPHFTVTIPDAKYPALMALVSKWRSIPQKSYSLNKRNCVHFVDEAIKLLGYKTNVKSKYWKKPTSYMKEVMKLNPKLKR